MFSVDYAGGDPVKTLGMEQATLDVCVCEAQGDRVLVTRDGRPVAMVVGLAGLDEEQLQLGTSDRFWELITARRKQRTVTRAELEQMSTDSDRQESRRSNFPSSEVD